MFRERRGSSETTEWTCSILGVRDETGPVILISLGVEHILDG